MPHIGSAGCCVDAHLSRRQPDCDAYKFSSRREKGDPVKTTIERAIAVVEAEYREMPGLMLTPGQAQRLLGLDIGTCARALATLTQRRFLKQTADGAYLRERPG